MFIQYSVLGFELTTFGSRVSSHNYQTREPTPLTTLCWLSLAQKQHCCVDRGISGTNYSQCFNRFKKSFTALTTDDHRSTEMMPDRKNGSRFGSFFRHHRLRHFPHSSRRDRCRHLVHGDLKVSGQCDQMVKLFLSIWPFATMKISPKCHKFATVGSAFCQIRNKPSKICQKLVNFCQIW